MSVKNKLKILWRWWTDLLPQKWPADPKERQKIHAYILGAGTGGASKGKSEVEDGSKNG